MPTSLFLLDIPDDQYNVQHQINISMKEMQIMVQFSVTPVLRKAILQAYYYYKSLKIYWNCDD